METRSLENSGCQDVLTSAVPILLSLLSAEEPPEGLKKNHQLRRYV